MKQIRQSHKVMKRNGEWVVKLDANLSHEIIMIRMLIKIILLFYYLFFQQKLSIFSDSKSPKVTFEN